MSVPARVGKTFSAFTLLTTGLLMAPAICPTAAGAAPEHQWECTPVKTPPCDCADVNDLINRWNIDNAAIAEYRHQIEGLKAREAVNGAPAMFSYPLYVNVVEANASALMKAMFSPGQTSAKGGTDGGCNTTIQSPTFCLCVVLKAHEDTHYNDCQQHKTNEPGRDYSDYRNSRTMIQVISDEIFGYKTEIDKINDILRSMPAKCKPQGWTGVLNYTETMATAGSTPIPPNVGAKVKGGTNSTSFTRTHTVTISVMNGEAYVNNDVTEVSRGGQEITSMVKCHSNEELREDPHHDNSVVTNEAHGYGKAPSFRVSFGVDSYSISVQTPPVTGTRSQTRDLSPAVCGPSFVPKPSNGPFALGEGSYKVSGKGKPTDPALSGSETHTEQLTGGTRTVTTSWSLFRSESNGPPVAELDSPQDAFQLNRRFETVSAAGQEGVLKPASRAALPCGQ